MWPFKRQNTFQAAPSSTPMDMPENWREQIQTCNFQLAKKELQAFFDFATRQAERDGKQVVYRTEFVRGWQVFAERPCFETAVAFIEGAPDYSSLIWGYFSECCPGGRWTLYDSQLSHLKKK